MSNLPKSDKYELLENGIYFYIRRLSDGFKSQKLMRKDEHLQRFIEAVPAGTFDLECGYTPRANPRAR